MPMVETRLGGGGRIESPGSTGSLGLLVALEMHDLPKQFFQRTSQKHSFLPMSCIPFPSHGVTSLDFSRWLR